MVHHMVVQGSLGAGKTFLGTLLAHHWKQKTEARGGKIQLYSNFDLKDSIIMNDYKKWYDVAQSRGSIIVWDEAHTAFSNRAWSNYGNGIATDVLMYTRKMQSLQIYCTPSINNLDSRIRQIVEILVTTRHIPNKGFSLHIVDYQTGEFLTKQFIPWSKAKRIFKLNLYDTQDMAYKFPLPNTPKQGDEFFEELKEIHDNARKGLI